MYMNIKDGVDINDLRGVKGTLLILLGEFITYAQTRNLPVTITSIIGDRANIKAISKTHEQGRAIDISSHGWELRDIDDVTQYLLEECSDIAAISGRTYLPNPCVYHDAGYGSHFHLQVR